MRKYNTNQFKEDSNIHSSNLDKGSKYVKNMDRKVQNKTLN